MREDYLAEDGLIEGLLLKEIIDKHYKEDVGRFIHYYDLYKGSHDILDRVDEPNKPNNKIVNDYFGQVVDDLVGYFLGVPLVIDVGDEEDVQELFSEINMENDFDDLFMEIGKEMCIKGRSSVLVYQDEEGATQLVRIPAEEVIFIYDNSKSKKLRYAIRVYEVEDVEKNEMVRYAEVYDKDKVVYYVEAVDVFTNTMSFVLDYGRSNPIESHIFGKVPVVSFINNEEELGDIEKIESLVNEFDRVMSDVSNEHEAYRNAYLMLKNMVVNGETIERMQKDGIIEVDDDGDVKFITKNIQIDAITSHLDRLENNIYKFAKVPNLSDENFAGNLSGVAIKFKLFGLENKCIIKERKMRRSLRDLMELVGVPIQVKTGKKVGKSDIYITFTRNIPANLLEITEMVEKLQGIVDKETLLNLLPFVDDPKYVLERLAEDEDMIYGDLTQFDHEVEDLYEEEDKMVEMEDMGLRGADLNDE